MSRFTLSPHENKDSAPLFRILRDPESMQFTYVAPSLEACSTRLVAWEAQRPKHGFAPWVVRLTCTSEIIGWGGLGVDPEDSEWGPELVYAFAPSAWGKGLATELVAYTLIHAFTERGLSRLEAFVHPDNKASIKVLQRAGFRFCAYEPRLQRNRFRIENQSSAA
jgi:[ribosomal protein S5]-alanine N-acetyltransferase